MPAFSPVEASVCNPVCGWDIRGCCVLVFRHPVAPVPRRPLRAGFEPNTPVQIRTDNGFSDASAIHRTRSAACIRS